MFFFCNFAHLKKIFMTVVKFDGFNLDIDGDGFMTNPTLWTREIAECIAKNDGISPLTENHWKVIDIIRNNFEEKGIAPMIRTVCKESGLKLKDIYELFPLGPARGACRVAGLPKPDGCV
jgi:tRNA 2-thiouridine synthesizing protein E